MTGKLNDVAPLALPEAPELELPVADAPLEAAVFEPEGLVELLLDDDELPLGLADVVGMEARLAILCQDALEFVEASPCL